MTKVAVLGLGNMGSEIAANLLDAGHDVTVYNRTAAKAERLKAKGALVAPTPRVAAEAATLILSIVGGASASRDVWLSETDGAIHGLRPGTIAVECTTCDVAWIGELAQQVTRAHCALLDAPVVGSQWHARRAELTFYIGGAEEVYERARATLAATASTLHFVGPSGHGTLMKLASHAVLASQVQTYLEAVGVAVAGGIPLEQAVGLLNQLPTASTFLQAVASQVLGELPRAAVPISVLRDALGQLVSTATSLRASTPMLTHAHHTYACAAASGLGAQNVSELASMFIAPG